MLDQQHRDLERIPYLPDVLHQLRRLRRVHARRRLVQQQQTRVRCQRPQDLQPPLRAVGQRARPLVGVALHVEDAQQLLRPFPGDVLLPRIPGEMQDTARQPVAHRVVHGHHQVLRHRQIIEQPDVLERPGDTGLVYLCGGHAVGVLAIQQDSARCGLIHLRQQVEHRGLARAVGADQPRDLRPADGQIEVLHRLQPAEGHAQPHALQHRGLVDVPFRQQHGGLALHQFRFRRHSAARSFRPGVSFSLAEAKNRFIVGLFVACITRISTMAYTSIR